MRGTWMSRPSHALVRRIRQVEIIKQAYPYCLEVDSWEDEEATARQETGKAPRCMLECQEWLEGFDEDLQKGIEAFCACKRFFGCFFLPSLQEARDRHQRALTAGRASPRDGVDSARASGKSWKNWMSCMSAACLF